MNTVSKCDICIHEHFISKDNIAINIYPPHLKGHECPVNTPTCHIIPHVVE